MGRFLFFIVNPYAGAAHGWNTRRMVREAVRRAGEAEMKVLRRGEPIDQVAGEGIGKGATDIIAVGGDGTVGGVASALVGTKVNLGIVPAGTANMFARELNIPITVPAALALITGRHGIMEIDAMELNGRRFIYQVTLGPSSEAMSRITADEKRLLGRSAYALLGLRMFQDFHPLKVRGLIDGEEVRLWASQIIIANAGILGLRPFRLGSDIRVDDGRVEVIFMRGRSRTAFMAAGIDLLAGNYRSSPGLRYHPSRRSVVLETEPPAIIKADGEFVGRTPLELTVLPRAVKVIISPTGAGGGF